MQRDQALREVQHAEGPGTWGGSACGGTGHLGRCSMQRDQALREVQHVDGPVT